VCTIDVLGVEVRADDVNHADRQGTVLLQRSLDAVVVARHQPCNVPVGLEVAVDGAPEQVLVEHEFFKDAVAWTIDKGDCYRLLLFVVHALCMWLCVCVGGCLVLLVVWARARVFFVVVWCNNIQWQMECRLLTDTPTQIYVCDATMTHQQTHTHTHVTANRVAFLTCKPTRFASARFSYVHPAIQYVLRARVCWRVKSEH